MIKFVNKQNSIYILLITIFFSLNYLVNITKNYTFDTIGFVYAIREQITFQIFHSYHIIFLPVQILLLKIFQPSDNLVFLQNVNALVGIIALLLLYFILFKVSKNRILSFMTVLIAGTTLWFFRYSVDLELKVYNAVSILLTVLILLNYRNDKKHLFCYLLPSYVLQILFHQINVFFLPALVFVLFMRKTKIIDIIYFIAITFFSVFLIYFLIGIIYIEITSIKDFFYWITYYQQLGYWGGFAGSTFKEALLGFGWSIMGKGNVKIFFLYIIIFSYLFILIRDIKYFYNKYFFELGFSFLWFIFHSAVVIYWHPLNIENWYSQLALWIPFVIISNHIYRKYCRFFFLFFLLFFVFNYLNIYQTYIKPYRKAESNINLVLTNQMGSILNHNDNLIIAGEGKHANLTIYLKYFYPFINLYSVDELFVNNKSDFDETKNVLISIDNAYIFSDILINKNNVIQLISDKHNIDKDVFSDFLQNNIFNKVDFESKVLLYNNNYLISF